MKVGTLISLFLAFSLSGCGTSRVDRVSAPSPSNDFLLTESDLQATIARAELGDVEAMNALYFHYSVATGEDDLGYAWAVRAAEAGDKQARKVVVCHIYWHGSPTQKSKLDEMRRRWSVTSSC